MQPASTTEQTRPQQLGWRWAMFILLATAVMLPFLGPFALIVTGSALVAAGITMRRSAPNTQDRAIATGLLAAGLAIAGVALALLLLLVPVSELGPSVMAPIPDVVTAIQGS